MRYIIKDFDKLICIIDLDDSDVVENEFENYHGRFYSELKLTSSGKDKLRRTFENIVLPVGYSICKFDETEYHNQLQRISKMRRHYEQMYECVQSTKDNIIFPQL